MVNQGWTSTGLGGKRTERQLAMRAADVKGLLGRHVPQTRHLLHKPIQDEIVNGKRRPGRIVCTPFDDARGRGYVFTARASYAGLLSEKMLVKGGVEGIHNLHYFALRSVSR
jgi:hypothetical protein